MNSWKMLMCWCRSRWGKRAVQLRWTDTWTLLKVSPNAPALQNAALGQCFHAQTNTGHYVTPPRRCSFSNSLSCCSSALQKVSRWVRLSEDGKEPKLRIHQLRHLRMGLPVAVPPDDPGLLGEPLPPRKVQGVRRRGYRGNTYQDFI